MPTQLDVFDIIRLVKSDIDFSMVIFLGRINCLI
jgi:hypothetical protein